MGAKSSRETDHVVLQKNPERFLFIRFISHKNKRFQSSIRSLIGGNVQTVYHFEVNYLRYQWSLEKTLNEIYDLDSIILKLQPEIVSNIALPVRNYALSAGDYQVSTARGNRIAIYLQTVVDSYELFSSPPVKQFLSISSVSFIPSLGRKPLKEGWLRKYSGGYKAKFSRNYHSLRPISVITKRTSM
jgi:hypothetical protein